MVTIKKQHANGKDKIGRELEWKVCYEEVCFILIDECVGYGGFAGWVGSGATGCLADDI